MGGRKGEKHQETSMSNCLSCTPYWVTGPQPRFESFTGNQSCHPLVCRPALNPLNHTSQGWLLLICALTKDKTCYLGVSVGCSNQLNYPAQPGTFFLFFIVIRGYAYWFSREGKGWRETSMWERNIHQLPLTHAPTWDHTWDLGTSPD